MISPLIERLPAPARTKLQELEMQRDSALDASHAAQSRINMTPPNSTIVERLTRERDRFAEKHRVFSRIVSACNQFTMESRNKVLEAAPPVAVELKPSERLADRVSNVRAEIAALGQQLAKVKIAPLPVSDREELVNQYVSRLFQEGRPAVSIQRDALKVTFKGDMFAPEDVMRLLAWAFPGALAKALDREVADMPLPNGADAMPAAERIKKTAELETELLILARKEEALVERAAADGLEILRRPEASPLAVLGVQVQIVAAQAQAEAAA
jgi:hypothetical protein